MSCYIGLSIQQELDAETYQEALSEIEDFVSQTNLQIIDNASLLIIGNKYQKFYLPRNSDYIHSNLQHFIVSENEDEELVENVVQCLMILKEYLPHKIQIQLISQLQQIFNLKIKIQQQIPRRLTSRLKTLSQKSKKHALKQQQIHSLIYNLASDFHKDYNQKIKIISLKILSQGKIQQKMWNCLSKQEIKIIDGIVNQTLYQKYAIQVLERIVRSNDFQIGKIQGSKENVTPNSSSFANTYREEQESIPEYQGPLDPMTAIFQLKESLNLSRISWIIQNVDCEKLPAKRLAKFDSKIKEIAQKFLKDLYPDTTIGQLKNFGRVLAEYQMRRSNLVWDGLIEEVLIKIEDKEKVIQKGKSKMRGNGKQVKV